MGIAAALELLGMMPKTKIHWRVSLVETSDHVKRDGFSIGIDAFSTKCVI